jgi:hypothetical protein
MVAAMVVSVPEVAAVVSVPGVEAVQWSVEPVHLRVGPWNQGLQSVDCPKSAVVEERRYFLGRQSREEAEQPPAAEANSNHRADRGMDTGSSMADSKPGRHQPR